MVAGGGPAGGGLWPVVSNTDILDLDTMNWMVGGDMNHARYSPQMAVVGGRILVLGGYTNDDGDLSTIEELSLEDWTWTMMELEMGEERSDFSAVVIPKEMVSP